MKKHLKSLVLLLVLLTVLSSAALSLSANEVATSATVTASGTTGDLTWVLTSDGTLTISGEGEMPDYDQPWENYCSTIEKVVIQNGVTSIGASAFAKCESLTSITISDSVTSIGNYAFYGCTSLTSVTIPNAVTYIREGTFHRCTSLTSIIIPEGVTSIGYIAFCVCTSLTSVTIPDSVMWISESAFDGFVPLQTVYYTGSPLRWNRISIEEGNTNLTNAELVFIHADGTEHEFINHEGKAPTCTESGWAEYVTCSKCDYTTYEEIPATGHNFVNGVCAGCGEKYQGLASEDGGVRFYQNGVAQYGWVDTDGDGTKDSYFYSTTKLRCEVDRMLFDGIATRRFYKYNPDTGFMEVVDGFYTDENGTQFFKNGLGKYGWITADGENITDKPGITLSGVHYFAYGDGLNFYMVEDETKTIGGVVREFDENHLVKAYTGWATNKTTGNANYYVEGELQQGWFETENGWVYLSRSENLANNITYGDAFYGWRKVGGKVYYFRATTSTPAYVIISDPSRQLTYEGVRSTYYINQTPANGSTLVGSDYYITNPPAGF